MRLAIIPARGGSKRIPRKNIKLFRGKPIIGWSIEAAHTSKCFNRIIVSTDDHEIAQVAKDFGAEVPFVRPLELSNDNTGTIPVISHAIEYHNNNCSESDNATEVCCIYATAPFLQANDLKRGLFELQKTGAEYAFSVTKYPFPIQRAIRITNNNRVEMFQPEYFTKRSQDLDEAWHDAGQFYWGHAKTWLTQKPVFSIYSAPVVLDRKKVQDIDTHEDWEYAELMHKIISPSI